MEYSLETIRALVVRSRLLTEDEVRAAHERWLHEGKGGSGSGLHFLKWLVAREVLTEYQAALITRGQADDFFLGRYKILDRLGRGRMAGVYKAVHESGQVVAIKVLPPSRSRDAQLLQRFLREAKLAIKLKHPNIVRTFQLGRAKGLHYIVMEYLDGETLEDTLRRRHRLPVEESVRLVYQALQGLQHIHEMGMIHRDLKPANLMIVGMQQGRPSPESTLQSMVKILDIGLGRRLLDKAAAIPGEDPLTTPGMVLGTPDYLAPEQAKDPRTIDIRADIYSLGCVLYHCLTGQPPFPDNSSLSQMIRHATEPPRPLAELNPDVPDGLQQIMNWMLAKDPNQRYPTPERAAKALAIFLVAGAEVQPIEDSAQMRSYLSSLKKTNVQAEPKVQEVRRHGDEKQVASASKPAAPPKQLPPKEKSSKRLKAARNKKPSAAKVKPASEIVGQNPLPAQRPVYLLDDFGVELVPVPESQLESTSQAYSSISIRDLIFMGIGAGTVMVAVLIGWIMSKLL